MTLGLSLKVSTGATLALGVATVVFSLAGGWLADRVGRRAVMLLPRGLLVVIAVPAFAWIIHAPTATGVLGVTITLSAMAALRRRRLDRRHPRGFATRGAQRRLGDCAPVLVGAGESG